MANSAFVFNVPIYYTINIKFNKNFKTEFLGRKCMILDTHICTLNVKCRKINHYITVNNPEVTACYVPEEFSFGTSSSSNTS